MGGKLFYAMIYMRNK